MSNMKCVCYSRCQSCAICVISVLEQWLACTMCPVCAEATPKRKITCCTMDCAAGIKQPRQCCVATRHAWYPAEQLVLKILLRVGSSAAFATSHAKCHFLATHLMSAYKTYSCQVVVV